MSLLTRVVGPRPGPFALIHRPASDRHRVDVLIGDVSHPASLSDVAIPDAVPSDPATATEHDVLLLLPYRQLSERGFACPDDGTPLVALTVSASEQVPLAEVLDRVPDTPLYPSATEVEPNDAAYADRVRRIIDDEIAGGQGANFVLRRTFSTDLAGDPVTTALTVFRRMLEREHGAHWTFVVYTGDRILVGASPERHVSLSDGVATMNPISGTYRYPSGGADLSGVMDFLADRKETGELAMVLDEELKMMARVCERGGRVTGPYLKEMAAVAHTEYFISGRTDRDPRDILRETLFAPTVTGSPLESACHVINRYEPEGRGYYSGVAALVGRDGSGRHTMDSTILIRTADIDATGRLSLAVGATIVRDSDPHDEAAETRAKAESMLAALRTPSRHALAAHPRVRAALTRRNNDLSRFWLGTSTPECGPEELSGLSVLVVDAEDTFTAMMVHQLATTGADVTVRRFDAPYDDADHDLVLFGPGPGDPADPNSPKMRHLRSGIRRLLTLRRPFLAVCLSHQILSLELGLEVARRARPNQGVQRQIDLFGTPERVGFYNSFAARSTAEVFEADDVGRVEVSGDPGTGEVHALRGPTFASVQFHAESVLTIEGDRILTQLAADVLRSDLAPVGTALLAKGAHR